MSLRSDPHGEFRGKNVLIELGEKPVSQTALHFKRDEAEIRMSLDEACKTMLEFRRKYRPAPILDDKIITAWNAMMISACAQAHLAFSLGAGKVSESHSFRQTAERAMNALNNDLFTVDNEGNKKLMHSVRYVQHYKTQTEECVRGPSAFADDYAWLIAANLDLYLATCSVRYIQNAIVLQDCMDHKFRKGNSYLSGDPKDDPSVLVQIAEMNDGADPSPNSVALGNLFRLHNIIDENGGQKYLDMANAIWFWAQPTASEVPNAFPLMVANSLLYNSEISRQLKIVITANTCEHSDVKAFLREIHSHFLPTLSLLCITSQEEYDYLSTLNRTIRGLSWPLTDCHAVVYVCAGFTCQPPITELSALSASLNSFTINAGH